MLTSTVDITPLIGEDADMEHIIPHTIYVKDYEQAVPTLDLLRKERDALMALVQVYGPLPVDYRLRTGGKGDDLYMDAHERLQAVNRSIARLTNPEA